MFRLIQLWCLYSKYEATASSWFSLAQRLETASLQYTVYLIHVEKCQALVLRGFYAELFC